MYMNAKLTDLDDEMGVVNEGKKRFIGASQIVILSNLVISSFIY